MPSRFSAERTSAEARTAPCGTRRTSRSVYKLDLERLQNLMYRPHRRTDGQTGSLSTTPLVGMRCKAVPRGTCCSLRTEVRRQSTKTCVSCIALFTMSIAVCCHPASSIIRSCDRTAKHTPRRCSCQSGRLLQRSQ